MVLTIHSYELRYERPQKTQTLLTEEQEEIADSKRKRGVGFGDLDRDIVRENSELF
jgi:hypothetical protein